MYAIVIGFYSTLFKFFDFGPNNIVALETNQCAQGWWKNLIYVTNLDAFPDKPGSVSLHHFMKRTLD